MEPEAEFRTQLEERINRYISQRDHLQAKLLELNHALNSLDKRLEAAVEMFRLEFGEEPPNMAAPTPAREPRRRRSGGTSWNQAIIDALTAAGEPLHITELWRRMMEKGLTLRRRIRFGPSRPSLYATRPYTAQAPTPTH